MHEIPIVDPPPFTPTLTLALTPALTLTRHTRTSHSHCFSDFAVL